MTFAQRAALRLAALAALVALAVSFALLLHHARLRDPHAPSICAVSARIDCNTVLRSRYALAWGVPIAAWGAGLYAGVFALALGGLWRPAAANRHAALIALGGLGAVGLSAWLFYVSHWRLHVLCLLCHSLYVTNVAIALAGHWARRAGGGSWRTLIVDEGARLRAAPVRAAVGLLLLGAIAIALPVLEGRRRAAWIERSEYGKVVRGEWRRIPPEALPIEGRPSKGPADAPVVIVEFADFECPFCADARYVLDDILASYPVRLVYMHYPMGPCNPNAAHIGHRFACAAAAASEIALREGRFWAFHEAVMAQPHLLGTAEGRRALAERSGLPGDLFERVMTDTEARLAVVKDGIVGGAAGVTGTPAFFVNGMGFAGLPPAWMMHEIVRREIDRVRRGEVEWRPSDRTAPGG